VIGIPVALTSWSGFFEEAKATVLTLKRERGLIGQPAPPRLFIILGKMLVKLAMSKEFIGTACL
jgi:hypothetical protein